MLWRSVSAWADLILQWATDNALIGVAPWEVDITTDQIGTALNDWRIRHDNT